MIVKLGSEAIICEEQASWTSNAAKQAPQAEEKDSSQGKQQSGASGPAAKRSFLMLTY